MATLGYNVSQAPRFEQAEIYLLILDILNDEQKRRKFSDDITKMVNEAKKIIPNDFRSVHPRNVRYNSE